MSFAATAACPHCRTDIPSDALVCAHCRRDVLFDLLLDQAIDDPRRKYQIARELAGRATVPFATANDLLTQPGCRLLRARSRAETQALASWLADSGVSTHEVLTRAGGEDRVSKPKSQLPVVAGLLVTCGLIGAGVFALLREDAPASEAAVGAITPTSAPTTPSVQEIAERALSATVALRCPGSIGSGFFVEAHLILTNAHVLCAGREVEVSFRDGTSAKGRWVARDDDLDLATVAVDSRATEPLPLGDSGPIVVRDTVLVVGSPVGLEATATEGGISNVERTVFGLAYLQTDAAVNPGNSGGPMLDRRGSVIGVISLKHSGAEGVGLALPINYAYRANGLLGKPPVNDSPIFNARAERAAAGGEKAARELADNAHRPALGRVEVDRGAKVAMAAVTWLAARSEPSGPLPFNLKIDGGPVCVASARLVQVVALPPDGPQTSLFERGLPRGYVPVGQAYAAMVVVNFDTCPISSATRGTIELVGGFEGLNIATF